MLDEDEEERRKADDSERMLRMCVNTTGSWRRLFVCAENNERRERGREREAEQIKKRGTVTKTYELKGKKQGDFKKIGEGNKHSRGLWRKERGTMKRVDKGKTVIDEK